jgi:hypothetical protein
MQSLKEYISEICFILQIGNLEYTFISSINWKNCNKRMSDVLMIMIYGLQSNSYGVF